MRKEACLSEKAVFVFLSREKVFFSGGGEGGMKKDFNRIDALNYKREKRSARRRQEKGLVVVSLKENNRIPCEPRHHKQGRKAASEKEIVLKPLRTEA